MYINLLKGSFVLKLNTFKCIHILTLIIKDARARCSSCTLTFNVISYMIISRLRIDIRTHVYFNVHIGICCTRG